LSLNGSADSPLRTEPLDHPQGDHHRDSRVLSRKPALQAGRAHSSPHPAHSVRRKPSASADRVATFNQDGTLWVEHLLYAQAFLHWIK
jgi:hypothetical protein